MRTRVLMEPIGRFARPSPSLVVQIEFARFTQKLFDVVSASAGHYVGGRFAVLAASNEDAAAANVAAIIDDDVSKLIIIADFNSNFLARPFPLLLLILLLCLLSKQSDANWRRGKCSLAESRLQALINVQPRRLTCRIPLLT